MLAKRVPVQGGSVRDRIAKQITELESKENAR